MQRLSCDDGSVTPVDMGKCKLFALMQIFKSKLIWRLCNYSKLMRINKPIGIWLLLWPTLWALWLASEGTPNQGIFVIFILGVIIMRSAGCVLNDYVDRKIDPYVERTQNRPIASEVVTPLEALILFAALSLIAIGLATMLNKQTQLLAIVAGGLTITYPFVKHYFSIPQLILGAAFGWAVPMAFTAETGKTSELAWLVFGSTMIWVIIYDTFYAMVDREDDLKIGVKSTAILFGNFDLFVIAGLQVLMLLALIMIGYLAELSVWYYASIFFAAGFMVYHLWLARDRQPEGCFAAFLNNHIIGLIVFIGLLLHYTFNPSIA